MRSRVSIVQRVVMAVAMPMLAVLAVILIGCTSAPPQPMHSAANVPASEGTVKATRGDNDNTLVEIHVKHLAPPAKVASDATTYVVWVQPMDGALQNVGEMILDSNLDGSLNTLTVYHRFKLTVTPEPNAAVAQPTHEAVFTANVVRTE